MPTAPTQTAQADHPLLPQAERIVAAQIAAAAGSSRGTNLHGWATSERRIQTVDEVLAGLIEKAASSAAYAASPEGRFHRAAFLIYEATGDEGLLQCHSAGLDTNYERASRLLTEMSGPAAEAATAALTEWLADQAVSPLSRSSVAAGKRVAA